VYPGLAHSNEGRNHRRQGSCASVHKAPQALQALVPYIKMQACDNVAYCYRMLLAIDFWKSGFEDTMKLGFFSWTKATKLMLLL
jgi:hypothetical protein